MATVRLDNLIKPRIKNFKDSNLKTEYTQKPELYTDLSLDMKVSKSIGSGLNVVDSGDILVSNDDEAIKNSLFNIFTTKKGQKILNPEFGSSLDQYLFDDVNNFVGQSLGQNIFDTISRYEPRINIIYVNVYPLPDLNQYNVKIYYRKINGEGMINLSLDRNGLLNVE